MMPASTSGRRRARFEGCAAARRGLRTASVFATVVVISASSSDVVDMPKTLGAARGGDNGATREILHPASPLIECLVGLLVAGRLRFRAAFPARRLICEQPS